MESLTQKLKKRARSSSIVVGTFRGVRRLFRYGGMLRAYQRFQSMARSTGSAARLPMSLSDLYPCLDDLTSSTYFDRHYIYHPAWALRLIVGLRPAEHVDISSTLAFCSMLSAFVKTRFYDYRPADLRLPGLETGKADLSKLPFADGSIASLSCMHVVEHIGLGRYGDPLDPEGDLKAMKELARVLAPGGNLFFAVPVGKPRIQFNAHRIYSVEQIKTCFAGLELAEFTLIPELEEDGGLIKDPPRELLEKQSYGCGCFWFRKPKA